MSLNIKYSQPYHEMESSFIWICSYSIDFHVVFTLHGFRVPRALMAYVHCNIVRVKYFHIFLC